MNWIYDNPEKVLSLALIAIPFFTWLGLMLLFISGETKEASELEDFEESLGDIPPLVSLEEWQNAKEQK